MKLARTIVGCALLAAAGFALAQGRPPAPALGYYAKSFHGGSRWGALLDTVLGGKVLLDPSSSQPKGYVSKLYDGDPGKLDDPTGTFLVFDGPHAAFRVLVPAWREVDRFEFYALEAAAGTRARARLTFVEAGGGRTQIPLVRRVVGTKQGMAHVRYRSRPVHLSAHDGAFRLGYDNPDFASAFVSEIALDGLGDGARFESASSNRSGRQSRLVSWQRVGGPASNGATLHSLLVQVSGTGDPGHDLVAAWIAHPTEAPRDPVPLAILLQDPASPYPALELLGLEGRPEFAFAPALVRRGIAVLVMDLEGAESSSAFRERLRSVVDQVLDGAFAQRSGLRFDRRRVGLWGFGHGATLAMRAASADPRYRRIALSHPPDSYCAGRPFATDCGSEREPLSGLAARLLRASAQRDILVVGDAATMRWWQRERGHGGAHVEVRGAVGAVPGPGETGLVADFFSGRLAAAGEGEDEIATKPEQLERRALRARERQREFDDAASGK